MAEEEKQKNSEVEEEMKKIPVFTVLKNGRIVKNIFLLENPPPPPPAASLEEDRSIKTSSPSSIDSDEEVNLIVGRHPDCDIVLEHPSISRFHLRILLKPSSQKLSLIDLSSVHGTWVLDRKIEPEVRFDLNEGDTMKLGSSTRVYRLHWVPLNRVFDEDNPLIFHDLKSSLPFEEKEPEGEEDFENEEPISSSIQMPETSLDLENLLPFDEEKDEINENESLISFLRGQDCFPSAPPMPQNMNSPFSDVEEESEALGFNEKENQNPFLIGENQSPLRGLEQWSDYVVSESVYLNLPVQLGTPAREQIDNENQNTGAVVAIDKLSELENVESPQRKLELKKSTAKSSRSRRAKTPADQQFDKENQNLEALIGKDLLYELDKQVSPLRKSEPKKSSGMSILSRRGTSANRQFNKENQNSQSHVTKDLLHELENLEPRKSEQKSGAKSIWSRRENSPAYQHFNKENQKPKSLVIKDLLHELENQNPQSHVTKDLLHELENLEPRKSEQKPGAKSIWSRRENSPAYQHFNKENQKPKSLVIKDLLHELENLESPPRKSEQKSDTKSIWSRREKSPAYGHFDKENQNPQALDTTMHVLSEFEDQDSPPRKSEQKSDTPSIWSRRGKSASSIQIQTGRSRTKGIEEASANVMEGAVVPKTLFMGPEHEEEEEMFTPDKENFTPKHVSGSKSTKKGRLEEIKNRSYSGSLSSKVVLNQNLDREEGLFDSANKENTTPLVLRESNSKKSASENRARLEPEMIMMKRIAGRVPFQSLLPNSPSMSNSDIWIPNSNATRSDTSVGCSPTVDRNYVSSPLSFQDHYIGEAMNRKWNMVVDTSCLLNKDSWKFLKLLEGLKETHLIIPRMVIRELDCLKRRGSLFRRTAEVSSVLEWIEECMMKTNWWIHVQNSLEESLPIAPTPPASPRILPNQGSGGPAFARSIPYCTWSLMEIASPTAEDHILDCALLFKKIKNGEQLVLLSNDVSLKIKAMAEGLICETAEEFRESLVNPFSGRFLWSESTPRGPTWSSLNDAASLRKNYYQFAVKKKTSKSYGEGAKGLKLILRHNSHYGQMSPVN